MAEGLPISQARSDPSSGGEEGSQGGYCVRRIMYSEAIYVSFGSLLTSTTFKELLHVFLHTCS